ncbi:MAG: hypothetical protein JWL59_1742 [Chthoniobacteraceae bacterium]|nr:hypothetical protein [Chthoniobacteraceae bacterium]
MRPTSAKILQHSEGLGTPNADTVRIRAHEIALINGHSQFSDEDWQQAKCELHGGHVSNSGDEENEMSIMVSERDMIICEAGHHVENMGPDDGVNIAEELLAEGMDEALHEQMLEARLAQPAEEEEIDGLKD